MDQWSVVKCFCTELCTVTTGYPNRWLIKPIFYLYNLAQKIHMLEGQFHIQPYPYLLGDMWSVYLSLPTWVRNLLVEVLEEAINLQQWVHFWGANQATHPTQWKILVCHIFDPLDDPNDCLEIHWALKLFRIKF